MNAEEAALFLAAMGALEQAQEAAEEASSAEKGLLEDAEPMTATCEVEWADGHGPETHEPA